MQISEPKNKDKIKQLVVDVCPIRKIQVLPYGPDICGYLTEDRLDDVVGGIIDDYPSKDLCNALGEGNDPWFGQCE